METLFWPPETFFISTANFKMNLQKENYFQQLWVIYESEPNGTALCGRDDSKVYTF